MFTDRCDIAEADCGQDGCAPVPANNVLFDLRTDVEVVTLDPCHLDALALFNLAETCKYERKGMKEKQDLEEQPHDGKDNLSICGDGDDVLEFFTDISDGFEHEQCTDSKNDKQGRILIEGGDLQYQGTHNNHIIPHPFINVILKNNLTVRDELKLLVLEFSIEKEINVRKVDANSDRLKDGIYSQLGKDYLVGTAPNVHPQSNQDQGLNADDPDILVTDERLARVLFRLGLQIHQLSLAQVRFRQHDACLQMLQEPAHFLDYLNFEEQLVLRFCLLFVLLVLVRLGCVLGPSLELRKAALALEIQVFCRIRKVKSLLDT